MFSVDFWTLAAFEADTLLRLAKVSGTPAPKVQTAINVLVNAGSSRGGMKRRLALYKFSPSEVDDYVDTAYPS